MREFEGGRCRHDLARVETGPVWGGTWRTARFARGEPGHCRNYLNHGPTRTSSMCRFRLWILDWGLRSEKLNTVSCCSMGALGSESCRAESKTGVDGKLAQSRLAMWLVLSEVEIMQRFDDRLAKKVAMKDNKNMHFNWQRAIHKVVR